MPTICCYITPIGRHTLRHITYSHRTHIESPNRKCYGWDSLRFANKYRLISASISISACCVYWYYCDAYALRVVLPKNHTGTYCVDYVARCSHKNDRQIVCAQNTQHTRSNLYAEAVVASTVRNSLRCITRTKHMYAQPKRFRTHLRDVLPCAECAQMFRSCEFLASIRPMFACIRCFRLHN